MPPIEWNPEKPPTDLPVVELQDFNEYLDNVLAEYEAFARSHRKKNEEGEEELVLIERVQQRKETEQETPKEFFDAEFSLSSQLLSSAWDSSSTLMQEKLAYFLDSVEVELVTQLSKRSDSFFEALSTLQELHNQVKETCQSIQHMRWQCNSLDEVMVLQGLYIPLLVQRKSNEVAVYNKLKLIETVRETVPTIQLLLSHSDFISALNLIEKTQQILQTELFGLVCFK